MPAAKPAAGAVPDVANPLSPNYGCWLLENAGAMETDSLHPTTTASPTGTAPVASTNPAGEPCLRFGGAGKLGPLVNIIAGGGGAGTFSGLIARIRPLSISGYDTIYGYTSQMYALHNGFIVSYPTADDSTVSVVNTWVTIGILVDSAVNNTKYVRNGVLSSTQAGSSFLPSTNANCSIGGNPAGEFFDGDIDYLYLYKNMVSLTVADILSIHNDPFQIFTAAAPTLPNQLIRTM